MKKAKQAMKVIKYANGGTSGKTLFIIENCSSLPAAITKVGHWQPVILQNSISGFNLQFIIALTCTLIFVAAHR